MTTDPGGASLIAPHGGQLKDLIADEAGRASLASEAQALVSWDLTPRQVCDIELLLNGGFSPLDGFMARADYDRVCAEMRLADGTLWPMPIPLDVSEHFGEGLVSGARIALRHPEGMVLAVMTVSDVWTPDRRAEAVAVFGTDDDFHPGVFSLLEGTNPVYVGGSIEGIELPPQHSFPALRRTPAELRALFERRGWTDVVAFQTRNPMHRAHIELTKRAAAQAGAKLLIHPVVGMTKPGDIDYFVRVRAYEAILERYPADSTELSLLPLAMRMAGPREALWHAIIRKNHGCTRLIVGRDHAGPGNDRSGKPFYGPYDAQELLREYRDELGIEVVEFQEMVYLQAEDRYVPAPEVKDGQKVLSLSGTELRRLLAEGEPVPEWFSYPEVVDVLRDAYPPRERQGFTVFFTGLPSSGKSTVANVLVSMLMERSSRPITLLDGDIVRKNLSSELGFSKEHRDINIKRIGFVASEITKHHGIAVCAPIAPYAATRREVRDMISAYGGFVEVHVATPLEVCEQRDRKGLYAQARAGRITGFTGIDDPYEAPEHAEVVIDTTTDSPAESAEQVLRFLSDAGYLPAGH
ncbi:MAG: bifunctional sulfate adenylyltransferase/adenylylsulfate kinase [Chloroflexi bacterium]|nr:bifunctional sulfate adenylyltransferase/adenylylsulfate kinase [Chloroflexota bacterium]